MFFVINKEKLNAYIVSILTVLVLFVMAGTIIPKGSTIDTSSNLANEIQIDANNKNSDTNSFRQNRLEYENE